MTAVLENQSGLFLIERNLVLPQIGCLSEPITQALDRSPAENRLLDNRLAILRRNPGVKEALRFDADERSHLAEAVATALFYRDDIFVRMQGPFVPRVFPELDLTGDRVLVKKRAEAVIDQKRSARDTAGAAAD